MPRIIYVGADGARREIDAPVGQSVMQVALAHDIEGIVAECNGNAACATCHVYLDDATAARLAPPAAHEADMLEFTAAERRQTSRLGCQIVLGAELEGMEVTVPDRQV